MINKTKFAIFAVLLSVASVLITNAIDTSSQAQGAGPCSANIPLCGQRTPYTAGAGIAIDSNNVISNTSSPTASLPLSGGTMSGNINMGTNAITNAGAISGTVGTFNTMTATAVAPTVSAAQIGYGSTTAAASNCNVTSPAPTACIVVNIAGTVHYIPYY